ncbi:MAG: hypothetical protein EBX37_18125, partial [Alphaproteobacteria bacterium]|nr:hypothetical protein [Alphaproteobacteria bacterium]
IFPAAFLVGGGIPLFWRAITKRNWRPFLHFTGAALVTGCIWVGISVAMFGWHAWVEFFDKILLHRSLMFIHCIGYKRLATFDMGLTDPFWESIGGWNGFNELQQETWSHNRWIHYPIMAALVALSAVAALRRPAYEAALLFGGMTVYVTQIATGYYYIYFPLCAVVLLGTAPSRLRDWAIFGVFFVQFMTWFNSVLTGDSVLHHIFICIEIGLFFLFWTCARIWEDWGHLIRRAFTPSVENTTPPPP